MKCLELNTDRLEFELKQIGKNKGWLAGEMGSTPAMVSYLFSKKPISFAEKLGEIFQVDPIKFIR